MRRIDARCAPDSGKVGTEHIAGPASLTIANVSLRGSGIAVHGFADVILSEGIAPRAHDQALLQAMYIAPQQGAVLALTPQQLGVLQAPLQYGAVLAIKLAAEEAVVQRGQQTVARAQAHQRE